MKREEAIKDLDIIRFNPHWDELVNEEYWQELMEMSIKALEEVQKYRAIGTVEECREAVEKQTAKKVKSISQVKDGDSYVGIIGRCPCCGDILEEDTVYCDCGQKLDWRNEG